MGLVARTGAAACALLLLAGCSNGPRQARSTGASPGRSTQSSPGLGRATTRQTTSPAARPACLLATTRGDFDGDGSQDEATLSVVSSAGKACRQAQYPATGHATFRLRVNFGNGDQWDRPFGYCTAGPCGQTVFTAIHLGADGGAELGVDIGPGADIDHVEIFRVDRTGFPPLQIAPGAKLRAVDLKPGPAILGGEFDSTAQSPVKCERVRDGAAALVVTKAAPVGAAIQGPWRVSRLELQLHGDTLNAVETSSATTHGFPTTAPPFQLACP